MLVRVFSRAAPRVLFSLLTAGVGGCGGGVAGSVSTASAVVEEAGPDPLTEVLGPIAKAHGMPALAARVMRGDRIVAEGVVGTRKHGDETQAGSDDRWHLGSDTKAMTATLAGMLVEEGKLSWSTTLAEGLPGVEVHPDYRDVTLSMLLAHRAGLPANPHDDLWREMLKPGDPAAQRRAAVEGMVTRAPSAERGKYLYSNAGYMTAGRMLEVASGRSWDDLMRDRVFARLGMSSCGFGLPAAPGKVDQPWGHVFDNGELHPLAIDNPPSLGPAGTVHCSLADWGKFLRVHLAGARGEPTILSSETMKTLQTPWPSGSYALGWGTGQSSSGEPFLGHDGSNGLFYASVSIVPKKNAIVMMVGNRADAEGQSGIVALTRELMERYVDNQP